MTSGPTTKPVESSGLWTMGRLIVRQHASHDSGRKYPRLVPVHGPVHASWLNQIEIYFSIVQTKALTVKRTADTETVRFSIVLPQDSEAARIGREPAATPSVR